MLLDFTNDRSQILSVNKKIVDRVKKSFYRPSVQENFDRSLRLAVLPEFTYSRVIQRSFPYEALGDENVHMREEDSNLERVAMIVNMQTDRDMRAEYYG